MVGSQLLPGTGPAVVALGGDVRQGSTGMFHVGMHTQLWWNEGNGWISLQGVCTSSPGAISRGPGIVDVFVRGTDGAMWSRWTNNGGNTESDWSQWYTYPGSQLLPGTGPAAYAFGGPNGHIGEFVVGTDNALWWNQGTGSSHWTSLGGFCTSSPAAISRADGWTYVFVRGSDGSLWMRMIENPDTGYWGSWYHVEGVYLYPGTGPAAFDCMDPHGGDHVGLVVVSGNGELFWNLGLYIYDWQPYVGSFGTSSPAAISRAVENIDVFVRGSDSAMWGTWTNDMGQSWNPWYNIA